MKRIILFLSLSLIACEDMETMRARRIGECKVKNPVPILVGSAPDGTGLYRAYDCISGTPVYFSSKGVEYRDGKRTIQIPSSN